MNYCDTKQNNRLCRVFFYIKHLPCVVCFALARVIPVHLPCVVCFCAHACDSTTIVDNFYFLYLCRYRTISVIFNILSFLLGKILPLFREKIIFHSNWISKYTMQMLITAIWLDEVVDRFTWIIE